MAKTASPATRCTASIARFGDDTATVTLDGVTHVVEIDWQDGQPFSMGLPEELEGERRLVDELLYQANVERAEAA